jgi:hypothetical protein
MRRLGSTIAFSMMVLSGVLAVSAFALMIRSYFREECVILDGPGIDGDCADWLVFSDAGRIEAQRVGYILVDSSSARFNSGTTSWRHHATTSGVSNDGQLRNLYTFEVGEANSIPRTVGVVTVVKNSFRMVVPHWFVFLVFATAPTIRVVRRLRSKRAKQAGFWLQMRKP